MTDSPKNVEGIANAGTTTTTNSSSVIQNDQLMSQLTPIKDSTTPDLQTLIDHHQQLQQWLQLVNNKIYEMESAYLEECSSGNIIKGWDIDGRNLPLHRSRNNIDEKDRLFSFSSYSYLMDKKNSSDPNANDKVVAQGTFSKANSLKYRKQKKRKADYEDWNGNEDY